MLLFYDIFVRETRKDCDTLKEGPLVQIIFVFTLLDFLIYIYIFYNWNYFYLFYLLFTPLWTTMRKDQLSIPFFLSLCLENIEQVSALFQWSIEECP